MRNIKEVLRLGAEGLSSREIARSLKLGCTTVQRYRDRAARAGLSQPLPPQLPESEIEARLFPPAAAGSDASRDAGLEAHRQGTQAAGGHPPVPVARVQDERRKARWIPVLRQEHRAGEKAFVDYAGQTAPVVDRETGEVLEAQIFVGVLGASNLTFAEATASQSLPDWIGSHVRMFEYLGGVPELIVQDNLGSGVRRRAATSPT